MEDLEFKIEDGGLWIEYLHSSDHARLDTHISEHPLSRITLWILPLGIFRPPNYKQTSLRPEVFSLKKNVSWNRIGLKDFDL